MKNNTLKTNDLKNTIKVQEKVISKMQKLVENRLKPPEYDELSAVKADPKVAEEIFRLNIILSEERDRVASRDNEITKLKKEIETLKSQVLNFMDTY